MLSLLRIDNFSKMDESRTSGITGIIQTNWIENFYKLRGNISSNSKFRIQDYLRLDITASAEPWALTYELPKNNDTYITGFSLKDFVSKNNQILSEHLEFSV